MDIKIIVAGTDLTLLDQLESRLRECGYRVGKVGSIPDLLRQLVHYHPSLVIVLNDRSSPAWDTKEACRRVWEVSEALVMVIVHKAQIVEMLQVGADDCVRWPVDWEELIARVAALLRRVAKRGRSRDSPALLAQAGLWINFDTQEVNVHGQDLTLTNEEFRLLAQLARNDGKVVSYDQLLAQVRDDGEKTGRGLVRQYIYRLRRKIERDPAKPQAILTHRGIGYSLDVCGL